MKGHRNRKRGFTLVETVVSVGIVAALAAVVYPVVARQFDSADPTRIQNDFSNIAIGIETFNVNNKLLPGDLDDLANRITTADSTLTTAATLPQFTVTGQWIGPYITASIVNTDSPEAFITSGFGAQILDTFVCYRADNNEHGISDATKAAANAVNDNACPTTVAGAPYFLAIQAISVACDPSSGSTFMRINELFDGANETNPETSGRLRCALSGAGSKAPDRDVVYFLAVPIT